MFGLLWASALQETKLKCVECHPTIKTTPLNPAFCGRWSAFPSMVLVLIYR